jgi:hypothetical protein
MEAIWVAAEMRVGPLPSAIALRALSDVSESGTQ